MTPIADMAEQLLAAGVSAEHVVAAIRAAERAAAQARSTGIPPDAAAEKRRAWDRARKAKKANSTGIPPEIPPDQDSALSSKEKEKSHRSPKERSRGEKLPPDWKPTERHYAEGLELGLNLQQVDGQAEDMRIWARTNEHRAVARKSDWDLTFTGWMRRNRNGPGPRQARADQAAGSGAARGDPILAGMGRIAQRISEKGHTAGSNGQVSGDHDLAGEPDPDRADEGSNGEGDRWAYEAHGKDAA